MSKSIRTLEDELGVTLFKRSQNGLEMTAYGTYVWQELQKIQKNLEIITIRLQQMKREEAGKVTVALLHGFSKDSLFGLNETIGKNIPLSSVECVHMTSEECIKSVCDGTVDIGIVLEKPDNPNLKSQVLFKVRHYAIVNRNDSLASHTILEISDLENKNLIMLNQNYRSHHIFIERCRLHGITPNIHSTVSELSPIFLSCILGEGVGIVPEFAVEKINKISELKAIPLCDEMTNEVFAVVRTGMERLLVKGPTSFSPFG